MYYAVLHKTAFPVPTNEVAHVHVLMSRARGLGLGLTSMHSETERGLESQ